MTPEAATAVLREEHRRILEVLEALERTLDAAPDGAWDRGFVSDCIAFFRLFADACHHGKEEDVLFPALAEAGMPADRGPIAVMLREHEEGRALVARMADAYARTEDGPAHARTQDGPAHDPRGREGGDPRRELERAAREYIALLRGHILKEDGILFEMADMALSGAACQRVCERYHPACLERLQGRTREELERLHADLLTRAPP